MRLTRRGRRRSNVQVRGCGCCLPLALALASVPAAIVWLAIARLRR